MTILHTSAVVRVHLHEPLGLLETEWLGSASSEELRQGLTKVLQLARRYQVRGWVADHTAMSLIRPADQEWIVEQFMPLFRALPLQRFGLVASRDPLNRMGVQAIIGRVKSSLGCETQSFPTALEARSWVAQAAVVR